LILKNQDLKNLTLKLEDLVRHVNSLLNNHSKILLSKNRINFLLFNLTQVA